jgi:hypothetical protein
MTAPGLVWRILLEPAEHAGLAPGQRIVEDRYQKGEGKLNVVMTWERITSEPSDMGKTYLDGQWSRKAIREYQECNTYALYHPSPDIRIGWIESPELPVRAEPPPSGTAEPKPDFDPDEDVDEDDKDDEGVE